MSTKKPDPVAAYLAEYPVVGPAEIATLFGVVRQRAYQITRTDDFPKPIANLTMGGIWDTRDVIAYAARRKRTITIDAPVEAAGIPIELLQSKEPTP